MNAATVALWPSLTDTRGRQETLSWAELFARFSAWQPFAGDGEHPGWSPAEFTPCERAAGNVGRLCAMVLDYDGTESIDGALATWGGFFGLLHTTRKSTPAAPRFRVILPLSRPVSRYEHAAMWRRIFARSGRKLDPQCKDPGRFWFTPGCPDRDTFQVHTLTGAPLDPDAMLAEAEPIEPRPADVIPIHRPAQANGGADPVRRASAYIAKMPEAIQGSGGSGALWAVALAAVQGFGLDEDSAFGLIWSEYNPRCSPPWSEREVRHKIADAATKAHVPRGYKLDERNDWRPPRSMPAWAPPAPPAEAYDPETGVVLDAEPEPASAPAETAARVFGLRSLAEILEGVYTSATTPRDRRGCSTGVALLDELIGGYRPGFVTVVGAATNWGKSSFAIMATNCAMDAERRVLLVSGEDTEDLYGQRFMAARANVRALSIRDGTVNEHEKAAMIDALATAPREPFFLAGNGKTAEYLAGAIRRICAETPIDLVIVDYLQAFTCAKKCQDRRNEVTHIARCFTDAIKGAKAAGLMFSQIKRLEDGQKPSMHDLKESGDVENMAEHVLMGWGTKSTDAAGVVKLERFIVVEKNKDGPKTHDDIELPFNMRTAAFRPQIRGDAWEGENSHG